MGIILGGENYSLGDTSLALGVPLVPHLKVVGSRRYLAFARCSFGPPPENAKTLHR